MGETKLLYCGHHPVSPELFTRQEHSKQLSNNIHRHLTNVHTDDEAIRENLMLPKTSLQRKVKL